MSYEEIYQNQLFQTRKIDNDNPIVLQQLITPNSMQIEALENLQKLRADKKNKALIISATGTGKTYLSAFDALAYNPNKLLFVVHRLTIAKDSMNTFQRVFGKTENNGHLFWKSKRIGL